jgi:hypothetical protein
MLNFLCQSRVQFTAFLTLETLHDLGEFQLEKFSRSITKVLLVKLGVRKAGLPPLSWFAIGLSAEAIEPAVL